MCWKEYRHEYWEVGVYVGEQDEYMSTVGHEKYNKSLWEAQFNPQ